MEKNNNFENVLSKEERASLIEQINKNSSSLSDEQLLKLFLSYVFREKELNTLWNKMENEIIDFSSLLDVDSLCMRFGCKDENIVSFFKASKRIFDLSNTSALKVGDIYFTNTLGPIFKDYIGGELVENLCVAFLGSDDRLIGVKRYSNFEKGRVNTHISETIKEALSNGTYKIVVAHNHVSGSLFCSESDYELSRVLGAETNAAGLILEEQFIVTKDGYIGVMGLADEEANGGEYY